MNTVKVKVCGITSLDDALAAVEYGADALGFVFAPSQRRVTPEQAQEIVQRLPAFALKVGVFVDAPLRDVTRTMDLCDLDFAQLHGRESPDYCDALAPRAIKAFRVRDGSILDDLPRYRTCAYLLDGFSPEAMGGTGTTFDWSMAVKAKRFGQVILSGGLTPENVLRAIAQVGPAAVDVSSGVEASPGRKDRLKLRAFITAVRAGELNLQETRP